MVTQWVRCIAFLSLILTAAGFICSEARSDQVLRFGLHVSAMGTLDPHFAAASQDRAVADMLFNGILRYVPGNAPQIEPDLARTMPSFRLEKGKQIWLIQLREGVLFHAAPGLPAHELTADDVIYSLEKSSDKQFCAYAGAYAGMTYKIIDDYSLEIILETPASPVMFFPKLTNYGGGFIVSKSAIETLGYEGFKAHPVGTGPFQFFSHDPGTSLVLTANPSYFRGPPKLAQVHIAFIPELADREERLKAGHLDLITGSGEDAWITATETAPGIAVDTHGAGEVGSVYLNTRMPPLDDIRVRKAIAYAISRQRFLEITSPRIAGPVFSQVPFQLLPGGLDQDQARTLNLDFPRNLELARQLMAEAGFPDGFTLDLVASEKRIYRRAYEVLKEQLSQIGITCRVQVLPHAAMHKAIRKDPKAIVIYFAWRPNADIYLTRFFHSDSIVVTGKQPDTNFSGYDKVDKLIEDARNAIDPLDQKRLWAQAQAQIRILDDMAALPLMFTRQCYARTDRLVYGHQLNATMALYPQFTEQTHFSMDPAQ